MTIFDDNQVEEEKTWVLITHSCDWLMINDNEEEEYFIDFDGEAEIEEEVNEQNIVRSFQKLRKQCDHWYQHLK